MAYKKAGIFITILLVLIFSFQLIPSLTTVTDGGENLSKNQGVLLVCNLGAHAQTFVQDSKRSDLQAHYSKTPWLFIYASGSGSVPAQLTNQKGIETDIHHRIKNFISHYFHGSKYKDMTLSA